MLRSLRIPAVAFVALLAPGCSYLGSALPEPLGERLGIARRPAAPALVAPAAPAAPADATGRSAFEAAERARAKRILVSLQDRWLWLLEGRDTLFSAPVAIGTGKDFEWQGKSWVFETPQGVRRVIGKEEDPRWVPPDWHYFEIAASRKLEPVHLRNGQKVALEDGTRIEVRRGEVGRVNQYGNFWAFTPGTEIIFDGRIFIPPYGSPQREVPLTLGTHKLDLGDGYLIHGTDQPTSIGNAASHGCIRMRNEDVSQLYAMVAVGTRVYIY
jgi:hypothetical protein